jgi:hypothetical protein
MSHLETSKTTGKSFLIFNRDELTPPEQKLYDAQAQAYKLAGQALDAFKVEFRKRKDVPDTVDVSCRYGRVNVSVGGKPARASSKPVMTLAQFIEQEAAR